MEYRTLVSEENEIPDGLDPTFTSFLHTERQEDQDNNEDRMTILFFLDFLSFWFSIEKILDGVIKRIWMISSFVSINTINVMDFSVYFSLKSLVLCKSSLFISH